MPEKSKQKIKTPHETVRGFYLLLLPDDQFCVRCVSICTSGVLLSML
jgi:hypothetical protein